MACNHQSSHLLVALMVFGLVDSRLDCMPHNCYVQIHAALAMTPSMDRLASIQIVCHHCRELGNWVVVC